jgi:CHAT domain-containing protein
MKLSQKRGLWIAVVFSFLGIGSIFSVIEDTPPVVAQAKSKAELIYDKGLSLYHQWTLTSMQKSIEIFEEAVQVSRLEKNLKIEVASLSKLGEVFANLDEEQKSLGYFKQALPIFRSLGDRLGEAKTLNRIASIYSGLGERQIELDFRHQALVIFQSIGDRETEAFILTNIAMTYSRLGEHQKALELLRQALPINRALEPEAVNPRAEAGTLIRIGLVYSASGDQKLALDYYNQALSIRRSIIARAGGSPSVLRDIRNTPRSQQIRVDKDLKMRLADAYSYEAFTLNSIGAVYLSQGDYQRALDHFNEGLIITDAIKQYVVHVDLEAKLLINIGKLYTILGKYNEAFDYYQKALPIIHRNSNDKHSELQFVQTQLFFELAFLYKKQNKLLEALDFINQALKSIEFTQAGLSDTSLKTSYFASVQNFYQLKIDILLQLHQRSPHQGYDISAFETSNQSRARVLRDLLIESNVDLYKDIPSHLKQQEQSLNQSIDSKEKQLSVAVSQSHTPEERDRLSQDIQALYVQREELQSKMRQASPAYAQLQAPPPPKIQEIQQQIDPDTLLLQYSLGEERSYLWLLSSTTLKVYIIPNQKNLEATIDKFREALLDEFISPEKSAIDLSNQILAPVATKLANKRLVIVPDGKLHSIPFAALAIPNQNQYTPLIVQHEIAYLPSASTIGLLRTTRKPQAPKTIALLADPVFSLNDPRFIQQPPKDNQKNNKSLDLYETLVRGDITDRAFSYKRLPYTANEAQGILRLIPNSSEKTFVQGFDANYNWIINPQISQYRYIHLATHAFFNRDRPVLSSIIFATVDEQGQDRKAFLRLPEIFNLKLSAELVVLSACQTGLGVNVPGEGIIGMTRGFMYAGSQRVMVSLWQVDDAATAELMQTFYQNLWEKLPTTHTDALRQAQLKLWNEGKHPNYWAAFILQGEWRN